MAIGKKVVSAFSGPADVNSFDMITHVPSSHTIKAKKSQAREELEQLYQDVRALREGESTNKSLAEIFEIVKNNHPNDWLLSVEIAELLQKNNQQELIPQVVHHLEHLKQSRPSVAHLITGGLELIFEKEKV